MGGKQSIIGVLVILEAMGITEFTVPAYKTKEEDLAGLSPDDKDWVTFHIGMNPPYTCDRLLVCDYETSKNPVFGGWYVTINYHS